MATGNIGVVGLSDSIPFGQFSTLQAELPDANFVDLSRPYDEIRWVRSPEELEWFKKSAYLTDLTCESLENNIRPGLTWRDLTRMVYEAHFPHGGSPGITYLSSTSMETPTRFIPWQFASGNTIRKGDIVLTEITISYWGYDAQIHRPFAVASKPTLIYKELFDVAYQCFEKVRKALRPDATSKQVVEASSIIEESGFTVYDSLLHGERGQNPELGTASSPHAFEEFKFEENMVMVIQPNPVDEKKGVGLQLGAAVVIKPGGSKCLHHYPFKFTVCWA